MPKGPFGVERPFAYSELTLIVPVYVESLMEDRTVVDRDKASGQIDMEKIEEIANNIENGLGEMMVSFSTDVGVHSPEDLTSPPKLGDISRIHFMFSADPVNVEGTDEGGMEMGLEPEYVDSAKVTVRYALGKSVVRKNMLDKIDNIIKRAGYKHDVRMGNWGVKTS